MLHKLPKHIEPFRFANAGRELSGEIKLVELPRLADVLHETSGVVKVAMRFDIDATGIPYMEGNISTVVTLTCERCLNELSLPININTLLGLVKHEKLIEKLSEQYEPWIIDESDTVEFSNIIEDELILALPLIARHEEDCLPEHAWFSGDIEDDEPVIEKPSPFAALSALKKKS